MYLYVESLSGKIFFTEKLENMNPGESVIIIKRKDIKMDEFNLKKILRQSFHVMNLGQSNGAFNPLGTA